MALPEPGENYWLPPEVGSHDKDGPRPHVVLSPANQNDAVVTLAFGSTSSLQAVVYYAPHVIVEQSSPMFRVTGLTETTYFYPSRLAVSLLTEMPNRAAGRIVDEFPELRDRELPRGVGLGTGSTNGKGTAAGSRRGTVARFSSEFSDLIGADFGVVVSWPPYSLRDQVQNVIPLVDAEEYEERAPNFAVRGGRWVEQLGNWRSVLLMVQLAQGAYDGGSLLPESERDIVEYLPTHVDDNTMNRLDEALALRLFGARLRDVAGSAFERD